MPRTKDNKSWYFGHSLNLINILCHNDNFPEASFIQLCDFRIPLALHACSRMFILVHSLRFVLIAFCWTPNFLPFTFLTYFYGQTFLLKICGMWGWGDIRSNFFSPQFALHAVKNNNNFTNEVLKRLKYQQPTHSDHMKLIFFNTRAALYFKYYIHKTG